MQELVRVTLRILRSARNGVLTDGPPYTKRCRLYTLRCFPKLYLQGLQTSCASRLEEPCVNDAPSYPEGSTLLPINEEFTSSAKKGSS